MTIDQKAILQQIDTILEKWTDARSRSKYNDCSDLGTEVSQLVTMLAATIERLAPRGSRYAENASAALKKYGENEAHTLIALPGILKALRADYEAGYLKSVHELIHGDIFGDFLEMAEYLLTEGYKDPAAVLAGGVLEEQLRKLCQASGIPVTKGTQPKKADALNADLAGANVYSKLDQKSITSWLGLRNNAAHGKYNEYSKAQVALMVQGVREFITRNPA
jgi:hypothetical protein